MPNRHSLFFLSTVFLFTFITLISAQTTNVWTNVTPAGIDLTTTWGTETVGCDPMRPSDLYANFNNYGIYRSTDYGLTWTGPVNTGANGSNITGDGNFTIASGGAGNPVTLYGAFEHNSAGFWRSTDAGVDWQNFNIAPAEDRQDILTADVDPYDPKHLIVTGHEHTGTYESKDGGQTWTNVVMDGGMNTISALVFFINTGSASTTAQTFIWIGQGGAGTWRSTNSGANWSRVDLNNGAVQLYQPGNGVVYMAGQGSAHGAGVLRSSDYGQTWTHVGASVNEVAVFGTPNHVYAMYGWACEPCSVNPAFEVAPQPGVTGWTSSPTPSGMTGGGISQAAVTYDGTHYILVASCWNKGLWRYIESLPTSIVTNQSSLVAKSGAVKEIGIRLIKTGIAICSTNGKFFDVNGRELVKNSIFRARQGI